MNLKIEDNKIIAVSEPLLEEEPCPECGEVDCLCWMDAPTSELVDLPFVVFNLGKLED